MLCCDWMQLIFSPKIPAIILEFLLGKNKRVQELFDAQETTCKLRSWPRGYFHIRRSGCLAPKFASAIRVRAPNFAFKNIGDKYPKFCPLNFRYNHKCSQNCDSFPTFASCGNRTSQVFPLFGELGWTPCPKFCL